jgi:hypothetical protein
MALAPTCPDCRTPLEPGFIPDMTYGQILQTHWHPGEPEQASFFGLSVGLKADKKEMLPIRAHRCPRCGLLRSFARPDR